MYQRLQILTKKPEIWPNDPDIRDEPDSGFAGFFAGLSGRIRTPGPVEKNGRTSGFSGFLGYNLIFFT